MKKKQTDSDRFFLPPDVPLGEPKRKFSETFDGIKMIIEHYKLKTIPKKTEN